MSPVTTAGARLKKRRNHSTLLYDFRIMKKILIYLPFFLLFVSAGRAQDIPVAEQLRRMRVAEDSLDNLLGKARRQYDMPDADRTAVGNRIVGLENELYTLRSHISKLDAALIENRAAEIEQQELVDPGSGMIAADGGVRTLFTNAFFTGNVSPSQLKVLLLAPRIDAEVGRSLQQIEGLYARLEQLKVAYDASRSQDSVDRMVAEAARLKEQIEGVDATVEQMTEALFGVKNDIYPVLLDKVGNVERLKLEQLDTESRLVRRARDLAGEQIAPMVSLYPLQKRLALDYEMILAGKTGLTRALDSLKAELKKTPEEPVLFPDIYFQPRNLVIYAPITKAAAFPYVSAGEVPPLNVPARGVYYTVQVGLYSTAPQSMAVFKNMTPLMREDLSGGRMRFCAGGFSNYRDAMAAYSQMIRAGFKSPAVVAWVDGKTVPLAAARSAEARTPAVSQNGGEYSVDIAPAEGRLPVALRDIISAKAPGKSIIRRMEGQAVVYSVGNFANESEASALASELRETEPNVKVQLVVQ